MSVSAIFADIVDVWESHRRSQAAFYCPYIPLSIYTPKVEPHWARIEHRVDQGGWWDAVGVLVHMGHRTQADIDGLERNLYDDCTRIWGPSGPAPCLWDMDGEIIYVRTHMMLHTITGLLGTA